MRGRMVLAFVVLAATSLIAQTFRGTILGTVTDPSGAVVAGAKVTAKNVNTGLERTTETSADGSYSVPELPIGGYTVTVTQGGFQTSSVTNVAVDVAAEKRVDVTLKAGQVTTTVEGSGEALPQGETPATILPVDAIEETQIVSNFMPEYGRNAGAGINIVTKSGTNALHGSGIEYFRNAALDARNYFNPTTSPKAEFHNNQFGGSLGG